MRVQVRMVEGGQVVRCGRGCRLGEKQGSVGPVAGARSVTVEEPHRMNCSPLLATRHGELLRLLPRLPPVLCRRRVSRPAHAGARPACEVPV